MTLIKKVIKKILFLKVADQERLLKYENIFRKRYPPHWSEEVFVIKKVKNNVMLREIVGTFYEKELQKNKSRIVESWKSNQKTRWC